MERTVLGGLIQRVVYKVQREGADAGGIGGQRRCNRQIARRVGNIARAGAVCSEGLIGIVRLNARHVAVRNNQQRA